MRQLSRFLPYIAYIIWCLVVIEALSPPMGWNPCNGFTCNMGKLNEKDFMEVADAMVSSGMKQAGYTYLNFDDSWQGDRLPNGTITEKSSSFPSGLGYLANYIHKKGLRFGLYTDRGTKTCGGSAGSKGYEILDLEQYASWGVDFVKADSCYASETHDAAIEDYRRMQKAINNTGRNMFFSLCGWWNWYGTLVGMGIGQSYRIATDVPNWSRFLLNVESSASVANLMRPGGWPDVDMISGHWNAVQERFHFSFIAIVGSPLLLSWDIRDSTKSTLPMSVYLNPEIVEVHQDPGPNDGLSQYYSRLTGGSVSPNGAYALTHQRCNATDASQLWHLNASTYSNNMYLNTTITGTLSTTALSGWCLATWSGFPGGCVDEVAAMLLPCPNSPSKKDGTCCGKNCSNYLWQMSEQQHYKTANSSYTFKNLAPTQHTGSYLSLDVSVPGALAVQTRLTDIRSNTQEWQYDMGSVRGSLLSLAADGSCLASPKLNDTNVWIRWLANGSIVLLFVNVGTKQAIVECNTECFHQAGFSAGTKFKVRDIWLRKDVGSAYSSDGFSQSLPPKGGSSILKFTQI